MKINDSLTAYLKRNSEDEKVAPTTISEPIRRYIIVKTNLSALVGAIDKEFPPSLDEEKKKQPTTSSEDLKKPEVDMHTIEEIRLRFNDLNLQAKAYLATDKELLSPNINRNKLKTERYKEFVQAAAEYEALLTEAKKDFKSIFMKYRFKSTKALSYIHTIGILSSKYYDDSKQKSQTSHIGFLRKRQLKNEKVLLEADLIEVRTMLLKLQSNLDSPYLEEYKNAHSDIAQVLSDIKDKEILSEKETGLIKEIIRDAVAGKLLIKSSNTDDMDTIVSKLNARDILLYMLEKVIPPGIIQKHKDEVDAAINTLEQQLIPLRGIYFEFFMLNKTKPEFSTEEKKLIKELDEQLLAVLSLVTKIYPATVNWSAEFTALARLYTAVPVDRQLKSEHEVKSPKGRHKRTTEGLRGSGLGQSSRSSLRSPTTPMSPSASSASSFPIPEGNENQDLSRSRSLSEAPPPPPNPPDESVVLQSKEPDIKVGMVERRKERSQQMLMGNSSPIRSRRETVYEEPTEPLPPPPAPDYPAPPPPPDYPAPPPPTRTTSKQSGKAYFERKPHSPPNTQQLHNNTPTVTKSKINKSNR